MAKARMLSRDACDDARLNRLSVEAELLYLLTLPHLDRDGLVDGRPSWLAGHCLSERPELHTRVGSFVEEWVTQGLVTRYQGGNGAVLFFHGFRKHNPNLVYEREQESKFPPPPGYQHGDHGLIPADPELAGRLVDAFDKRSLYRKALTEAATGKGESVTQHNKVMTSSRPDHDVVMMNTTEVEQQAEVETEVEVKSNNNGALHTLTLAEAEKAVVVVGVPALIASFDHDQTMALLSWLWLYNGWFDNELEYRDQFRRFYPHDPFLRMRSVPAVIVDNARSKSPAPLLKEDRAEMMDRLRQLQATP